MKAVGQTTNAEPVIALPAGLLLMAVLGAAALVGATWFAVTGLGGWSADIQASGLVGAAIVGVISALGVLIMGPRKPRPMSMWMTMWLAATVVRLFLTPALTFLLYFVVSLNAMALTISVASAYLAALLAESVILARHIGHHVYSASGASNASGAWSTDLQVPKGS